MRSIFVLSALLIFIFAIPIQAYIILEAKTEVSPGCQGGVLSHHCTSFINNNLNECNSDGSNLFDENSVSFNE